MFFMRTKKDQKNFDEGYFSAMRDALSLDIEHYGNGTGAKLIQEFGLRRSDFMKHFEVDDIQFIDSYVEEGTKRIKKIWVS
ncbi:hypothetical protein IV292_11420 [Enterococcus faecalis]|nr:hypothetical protein [Enterococcus faecalis]EOG94658.1 hypothetical protein SQ3_00316 [Enterococcus faecalis EnGen0212]EGO8070397.1 hypothetical protein [Enterococcus faecalis]EHZ5159899.1 hypothetical protein [Enterococcus faecalis]ELY8236765.1 hypothetical protein [Enterococcus faecalis]